MRAFEKIYNVVSLIPKGKVLTYKKVADLAGIKNPRVVGFAMHENLDTKLIPCHRVVGITGKLTGYARGGILRKKEILEKEGVFFLDKETVDLNKSLFKTTKTFLNYFQLLFKFDYPGKWPWYNNDKPHTMDEIVIGSILTQHTNWNNVQRSIENLRKEKINNIENIYKLALKDIEKLKRLIKPSGLYNQKAERLLVLSRFVIKKHKSLKRLSKLQTNKIREDLLSVKGIGKETADTILLYAFNKPIFIIDNYTKRFIDKHNLTGKKEYDELQDFFMKNLPTNTQVYQNYHALIVQWGKKILPASQQGGPL